MRWPSLPHLRQLILESSLEEVLPEVLEGPGGPRKYLRFILTWCWRARASLSVLRAPCRAARAASASVEAEDHRSGCCSDHGVAVPAA